MMMLRRFLELPFSRKTYLPVYAPPATHIRHAVSIDERRLKFRPALFCHDDELTIAESTKPQDIKVTHPPLFFCVHILTRRRKSGSVATTATSAVVGRHSTRKTCS